MFSVPLDNQLLGRRDIPTVRSESNLEDTINSENIKSTELADGIASNVVKVNHLAAVGSSLHDFRSFEDDIRERESLPESRSAMSRSFATAVQRDEDDDDSFATAFGKNDLGLSEQ